MVQYMLVAEQGSAEAASNAAWILKGAEYSSNPQMRVVARGLLER